MSASGNVSENQNRSGNHQEIDNHGPGNRTGICPELGGNHRKGNIDDRTVKTIHECRKCDGYEEEKGMFCDS